MGRNKVTAKKAKKAVVVATENHKIDQEQQIQELFEDVLKDFKKTKPMERDDPALKKWILKSINKYFDKALVNYIPDNWKSEKVWEEVINKTIKYRNINRSTLNGKKIKQKKVKESFKKRRFYMCLECWKDNR